MDARQVELLPTGYDALLKAIKERVSTAQVRAAVAVNTELVRLYWSIGNDILRKQQAEGWGSKVIDRLSRDLKASFPTMQGFSSRNLKYMRAFAAAWPDEAIVQVPLAQLSWYHHLTLLEKIKDPELRLWYAQKAVENGWSQPVLVHLPLRSRTWRRHYSKTPIILTSSRLPLMHRSGTWRRGFWCTYGSFC